MMVAGTHSGAGKTTLTLGILASLVRSGYRTVSFKVGPDFIDPGHHEHITGLPCHNLDGWMLSQKTNREIFSSHANRADIAVVEGVMGLYDGYDGKTEAGSTAQMAKWLNLPVILVVDARSMARSGAAVVKGFEVFDPAVRFLGVVFNNIGSRRHLEYLREAMDGHIRMPCLGGIFRDPAITLPERHLGLVTREENPVSKGQRENLIQLTESGLNMENILSLLPETSSNEIKQDTDEKTFFRKVRIGVARDKAFCFYYPDNLALLESAGADLVFFSPVEDDRLPDDLDGLYIGGGYPELYAAQLSENKGILTEVVSASLNGMPIYGECGGFMYLCNEIFDLNEKRFKMAGIFPFSVLMTEKRRALGYREITIRSDTIIGETGMTLRGHEFHYSDVIIGSGAEVTHVYKVTDRAGLEKSLEGHCVNQTLGSYFHLHFKSNPAAAGHLVAACQRFKQHKRGTA